MSKILDRYASAVRSSNLASKEATVYSDSDVLGAAGLAGKAHPLALALTRLFSGDNHASRDLVVLLADMAWGKAQRNRVKMRRVQADDLARAVLAWHRDGVCRHCGGHGFAIIAGTPTVGDTACRHCKGTRKMPFDSQFGERVTIARWLLAEIEREQAKAGPAAMAKLVEQANRGIVTESR